MPWGHFPLYVYNFDLFIHASKLSSCIFLYVYVRTVYMCAILYSPCAAAVRIYTFLTCMSQVVCQANVQCVLVYTMNTSHVFLLFSISDTANGT